MKKIYGKIFKELRLNKGYSIKEITDSDVSNATISKFEHGAAMISIDKFFRILSNINVSPSEFSMYIEDQLGVLYSSSSVTNNYAALDDKKKNLVKIEKTLRRLEKQYESNDDRKFLRIQIISLKAAISQVIPERKENIDTKSIQFIKKYLLSTKNWNDFELRTYCSTIHLFDLKTIEQLSSKLLDPFNYRLITPDTRWMINIGLVNLIDALINEIESHFDDSKNFFEKIVRYLEEHPLDDKYISEKIFLKFNIGCFRFLTGEKDIGITEMENATKALLYSDCDDYAHSFIVEFEKITGQIFPGS